jgi:hypothetical protein
MASIIRIKRSGVVGNPPTLAAGELAYSALLGTQSNGGDRLYIGFGAETTGNAANHYVIGGKYYTDLMSGVAGTLTTNATSVPILDSTGKIDKWYAGNLSLISNTIASSTGYITLNANNNIVQLAANNYIAGGSFDGSQLILDSTAELKQLRGGSVSLTVGAAGSATSTLTLNNDGSLTIPGTIKTLSNADITLTPNGSGSVVVSAGKEFRVTDLTSGRITFAGASGALKDSSTLTFNTSTNTLGTTNVTATATVQGADVKATNLTAGRLTFAGTGGLLSDSTSLTFNTGTNTLATVNITATTNIIAGATVQGADFKVTSLTAGRVTFADPGGVLVDASGLTYSTATNKLTVTTGLRSGNIDITGNTISSVDSNGNIVLAPNGSGKISINNLYTLATTTGTNGYVLTSDGAGGTAWQQSSSFLNIGVAGTSTVINLLSDTLRFVGGSGITTALSGTYVTFNLTTATTATQGIASFDSGDFTVTAGSVTIKTSRINDITGGMVSGAGATQQNITVGYDSGNGKLTFVVNTATNSTLGVAKFSSNSFDVTSGNVTIKTGGVSNSQLANSDVTIGSTTISLGNTSTTLAGLTQVDIGDIRISGTTIQAVTSGTINILTGVSSGTIAINNARITSVGEPQQPSDAATKDYVDRVAQGLHTHFAADAATTGTLASAIGGTVTYTTVTNGVGDYLTLSSPLTLLDNYAISNGQRILVKNEVTTAYNGIYVRTNSTRLTRADDFDTTAEVAGGDFIFVVNGTLNGDTGWVQTEVTTAIGASPILFSQFSGAGTYLAGDALTLTGNRFDVAVAASGGIEIVSDALQLKSTVAGDGLTYSSGAIAVGGTSNRITVSADAVDIASTYAGQTSITTVGTLSAGTWTATTIGAAYGGTGFSSYSAYDLLVGNGGGTLSKFALGTGGQILQVNTAGSALIYSDIDGGTY